MAMNKDWLPRGQVAFKMKLEAFLTAFLNIRATIGFGASTPDGIWFDGNMLQPSSAFMSAFKEWSDESTRSKSDTARLEHARAIVEPLFRELAGMLKRSPLVSDDDLVTLGLPPRHKGGNKPAPVAHTYPWGRVSATRLRCVSIEYGNTETGRKGKPKGQHGVECRWGMSDTPVVDVADLHNSAFDTRTPIELEFEGHERGKTIYFSLRWENTRGEKGPFGPIISAMIP
jgi:hypothetical protein